MRTSVICNLLLASSLAALAQAPTTPPMKLGLWQFDTTSKTQAGTAPGEKSGKRTVMSCITKNNWLTLLGPTASNACPKTNEAWTGQSYRFDVQCPGKPKVVLNSVVRSSIKDFVKEVKTRIQRGQVGEVPIFGQTNIEEWVHPVGRRH